jgi:Domain of unknown function (DUF5667)
MMDEKKDLDLIERIRSVDRYRPRAMFRVKVALASRLPSFGMALAGSKSPRLGWGPRADWTRPVKVVAAAAMALLVGILIFSGLVAASSGSLPGQTLYGLKRFREHVDLALTSSPTDKAKRYLTLASSRLSELDTMSQKGIINSDSARSIASDYAAETAGAAQVIKQASSPESPALARQLQELQTQKDNMVRRLAAASPAGILADTEGAKVYLNGAGVTGQTSGTTDSGGKVSFAANVTPDGAGELEAKIQADGRTAIVPVYQPASGARYTVTAQPGNRVLKLNEPIMFTLKVTRADGTPFGSGQVRLSDPTMTSTLDGRTGTVPARTDATGSCAVTVTKTSVEQVSPITLQVADPGWVDAGVVLRLGGVQAPSSAPVAGAVEVTSAGMGADLQRVVMDNGLVKVTAERSDDGAIVTAMTRSGSAAQCGPLYDPLPSQAKLIGRSVTASGPRLLFSNGHAAGYEIVLEMPADNGSITKDYKVFLSSGDRFATVQCRVEATGSAAGLFTSTPGLFCTSMLRIPAAASVAVGGHKVAMPQTPEGSTLLSFDIGNPYFTLTQGQDVTVAAFPIDSETYPQSLMLTTDSICPAPPGTIPADGMMSQTMVIGLLDKGSVDAVVSRARMGIGDPSLAASTSTDQSGEGFSVMVDPPLEKLANGKQKITLTVYKQYQKVLSGFQSQ